MDLNKPLAEPKKDWTCKTVSILNIWVASSCTILDIKYENIAFLIRNLLAQIAQNTISLRKQLVCGIICGEFTYHLGSGLWKPHL